jgi:biuret amidohydrolase
VTRPRIPATAGNSLTKLGNLSQLTEPDLILHNRGIRSLIVCGVTTEVCVNTTVREANDRGYECVVLSDCVGSYFPEFQRVALEMIKAQGGIFGWVSDSTRALAALGA